MSRLETSPTLLRISGRGLFPVSLPIFLVLSALLSSPACNSRTQPSSGFTKIEGNAEKNSSIARLPLNSLEAPSLERTTRAVHQQAVHQADGSGDPDKLIESGDSSLGTSHDDTRSITRLNVVVKPLKSLQGTIRFAIYRHESTFNRIEKAYQLFSLPLASHEIAETKGPDPNNSVRPNSDKDNSTSGVNRQMKEGKFVLELQDPIFLGRSEKIAIAVFQDLNENGALDKNAFGIPMEPYGFSRDPQTTFGPPRFSDSSIDIDRVQLDASGFHTTITLKGNP